MKISYFRGVFSADVNNRLGGISGAMVAVGLSNESVAPYLSQVAENTVVVACINAPNNVTLSGDALSIDQLQEAFTRDGIFVRRLRVKTAYHSHHVSHLFSTLSLKWLNTSNFSVRYSENMRLFCYHRILISTFVR